MQYVYILLSEQTGKLYKGCTNNLKRRISEHNSGKGSSTKAGAPWKLVYYASFSSKADALREEKFLKSGQGKARVQQLLKHTLEGWQSGRMHRS